MKTLAKIFGVVSYYVFHACVLIASIIGMLLIMIVSAIAFLNPFLIFLLELGEKKKAETEKREKFEC